MVQGFDESRSTQHSQGTKYTPAFDLDRVLTRQRGHVFLHDIPDDRELPEQSSLDDCFGDQRRASVVPHRLDLFPHTTRLHRSTRGRTRRTHAHTSVLSESNDHVESNHWGETHQLLYVQAKRESKERVGQHVREIVAILSIQLGAVHLRLIRVVFRFHHGQLLQIQLERYINSREERLHTEPAAYTCYW